MGGRRDSLQGVGLKRSMPCQDLLQTESSASNKKFRSCYHATDTFVKHLCMSSRTRTPRQLDKKEGTIDMWALFNPASAALESSNFDDLFLPKAVDMCATTGDNVLFVLPSAPPSLALPRCPFPTSSGTTSSSSNSKYGLVKAPFSDVGDVTTRELALARIAF